MKLIVGLGNPGIRYRETRHNVGFWAIDELSQLWQIPLTKEKWNAVYGEGFVHGEKVILYKPLTYMNLSGEAVRPICDFYQLSMDDLCVVYDDLDLPLGHLRLRVKGSAGGHNGMKSLIAHLRTDQFKRIKIGIGRPQRPIPVVDYVLTTFDELELPIMVDASKRAAEAIDCWLTEGFSQAMNKFHAPRE
ncbi:peptidyl-tRNA hydrolase [Seinonella peptonophila]|uniref:Peptidyl-tRNA hydrolase n=1 Tax=Seinonella peptonophila TaxID=112248 RepID=A0A1M4YN28_9BACL|nr:aminoacyl-tRNA hydrolase [Seinonella peptonophila]SHF06902.1 peptidyl-tRNA hydrolase [Seinonella peptonophila]